VIVDRYGKDFFGMLLTHDVLVEDRLDLIGNGQFALLRPIATFLDFFPDDVVAELDTLVADEYGRAGNQLPDFVLTLATKRAIQKFA
jgi:hypothetical protein